MGDNIKFGFLGVFVMIFLSWSVIEYKVKYEVVVEFLYIKEIIKWGIDYMLKIFNYILLNVDYVFV